MSTRHTTTKAIGTAFVLLAMLFGCERSLADEAKGGTWLESWKTQNQQWRALHLIGPKPEKLQTTKQLIAQVLAPMGFNVLILEINYGFQFESHPELECRGMNKRDARDLTDWCRKHGVRLIPLFNCLGHQSWAGTTFALLKKHPEFDETPHVPPDNKGIYCREWCPSHPDVNKIVFGLLDEIVDAFGADALHVGMDEVFLIGDEKCPRCRGKKPGELLAKVVNELHQHLVDEKGVEMLMWGDRLLDAQTTGYGRWEASDTGSHQAIDRISKDIIICDWHYNRRGDYPSISFFQEKGFRVLPSTWKTPDAAVALIRNARKDATSRMLGVLFTGWSAGGNGEYLLTALQEDMRGVGKQGSTKRLETARRIAATLRVGVKELDSAGPPSSENK